ncbi:MAG: TIGR03619 family F420-dependent LLM class oxidoreductase [Anaerolineae bacterium]|nr:TIGR03619 family F420-dependent LLM class oxidoreductase [Anaerolineae bacterium]
MRCAIYLPNHGVFGDARVLADLARTAEAAGWHGFFVWDHIAPTDDESRPLPCADPWLALTAAALQTTSLRLGTTVTPLPRRRPHQLARETATLDRLSNGRLILGVGIGLGQGEWDDLGEEPDQRTRGDMLDEGLAVLTGLWSGEPFHHDGPHYHVKGATFLPTPVQRPRVPVWVGGFWPALRPFRRMARWDGMFPLFAAFGPEQEPLFREAVAFVRAERERLGQPGPFDVIKLGMTPGDDPQEAAARIGPAAEAGATWWLELLMPEVYGFSPHDPAALDALRERVRQGPPCR